MNEWVPPTHVMKVHVPTGEVTSCWSSLNVLWNEEHILYRYLYWYISIIILVCCQWKLRATDLWRPLNCDLRQALQMRWIWPLTAVRCKVQEWIAKGAHAVALINFVNYCSIKFCGDVLVQGVCMCRYHKHGAKPPHNQYIIIRTYM